MGNTMLGPHINWKSDQIAWLRKVKPRVAKALLQNVDPVWMREAKEASPQTFWVGRLVVFPQPLESPKENAERFCNDLLLPAAQPYRGIIDALEGYNEIAFTQFKARAPSGLSRFLGTIARSNLEAVAREEMQRYALFEKTRAQLLAAQGWKSVVGNFSAGTPELELWPDFYPALEAGDYLGLHEYSANTHPPYLANLDTWLCRRYQRVYEALPENLRKPLVITECGIDGGMLGQAQEGWKRYTDAAGYLAELEWYDASLQADAARWPIVGATVYCYGHVDPRWETFDVHGEMSERLATYMLANPALPWKATEPAAPKDGLVERLSAEFGDKFDDIRADLMRAGEYDKRPLEGVNYHVIHHTGTGTTPQTYSNTIARYHVENNGWPGIGYHFLIYPHKVRYVGSLDTERANVWGRNAEVIGISLVGDFQTQAPADSTLDLCKRLCNVLDAYLARQLPRVGHRDVALPGHGTACPGESAYGPNGWLQRIQADAPAPPAPVDEELAAVRERIAVLERQLVTLGLELTRLQEIIARLKQAAG